MNSLAKRLLRVLVVEDSILMCKVLTTLLNGDPQIMVTAIATNGKEAVELVPHVQPDLITMDMEMPIMDGLEAIKQIMSSHPTPILILSSSVFKKGMEKVFRAISYGALDVMDKSELVLKEEMNSGEILIEKVEQLTQKKVMPYRSPGEERREILLSTSRKTRKPSSHKIVAMVASTGGPQALLRVLKPLPQNFPYGIVIVQHIATGFLSGLVQWLDKECRVKVKIAEDLEEIRSGVAYIAPENLQMRVKEGGRISLSSETAENGHRPSGDVLLESVARIYGRESIGIILTGMGRDGVIGLKAIKQNQGKTIAQDEKSCVVFGMPHAAIELGVVDKVLPPERNSEELLLMVD